MLDRVLSAIPKPRFGKFMPPSIEAGGNWPTCSLSTHREVEHLPFLSQYGRRGDEHLASFLALEQAEFIDSRPHPFGRYIANPVTQRQREQPSLIDDAGSFKDVIDRVACMGGILL